MTAQPRQFQIGSLVRIRERDWVVLPSDDQDIVNLRPLSGSEAETCGIHRVLEGDDLRAAEFPTPQPEHAGDYIAGKLLRNAARLSLRSGAGPFRSLGRLSVRPRPYQFVPLIMALRFDPVRMLIADDVGIGKTIEACLITRELLDRGDIQRICVLCPPHLCDQWQTELERKFHIPAVVLRSSTVARLERDLPRRDLRVWQYYPYIVASIDFVKMVTRRDEFLSFCPEMVIVDEAHTAAEPGGVASREQQLRHELVHKVAADPNRNLLLLTATPHSGIEHSFRSLLGLLAQRFENLDLDQLGERDRTALARQFVQRRRADVAKWLGETHFPTRRSEEATYPMGKDYLRLFEEVLDFTRETVQDAKDSAPRQRVRYWAALSMLRSLMSSPEAAIKSFDARQKKLAGNGEETDETAREREVLDSLGDGAVLDAVPEAPIEIALEHLQERDRRRLRDFARRAEGLKADDPKLAKAEAIVVNLLKQGSKPILYCRFVATAEYVARELQKRLEARFKDIRVMGITSETGNDEEREAKIAELVEFGRRVLVATDCLSEGINLQDHFDAVIHYDLPWNPNRLEQREGRVDRFGQTKGEVHAILLYSEQNRVDAIVLNVLLRKAREIYRSLGIMVPVPDSETVIKTVIETLFGKDSHQQIEFEFGHEPYVVKFHARLDRDAEREKVSRTKFAQHAIKPGEVAKELDAMDDVLGDPDSVRRFLQEAAQRFEFGFTKPDGHYRLDPARLQPDIRERLRWKSPVKIVFESPAPRGLEDAEIVVRNHPLIVALGDKVLGEVFKSKAQDRFARCGAAFTDTVSTRTGIALLRIRYCLQPKKAKKQNPLFAEEVVTVQFSSTSNGINWSKPNDPEVLQRLEELEPKGQISQQERVNQVQWALERLKAVEKDINAIADSRAVELSEAHDRLREQTGGARIEVRAHHPPDLLGVYVLVPGGGR